MEGAIDLVAPVFALASIGHLTGLHLQFASFFFVVDETVFVLAGFYAEEVEVKDSIDVIKRLHIRQYDLFRWAVGPKTLERLNEAGEK